MALQLEFTHPRPGAVSILARGEIDLAEADRVEKAIAEAGDAHDVLIDLSECEFLDSTGLAVLINARRELAAEGRRLVACAPGPQVARLLEVTGFHRSEMVAPSVQEALDAAADQALD